MNHPAHHPAAPAPFAVAVEGIFKAYGRTRVLEGVDLRVADREIVALLGPSGCGKTTLLRLLAGLDRPDVGSILLAGSPVAGGGVWVPPERRGVGLVFQDYALFPHRTVAENVAFGLRHLAKPDRPARVAEVLAQVDLVGYGARFPHELSGGQQQRVALARALAPRPRVLLMDEPFSNLDATLRRRLRVELRALLRELGISTVFVTHDQDEALSLADRVAVMAGGRIAQLGDPRALYQRPETVAVARAVGDANVLPGEAAGGRVRCALGELPGQGPDGAVQVILRPEQVGLAPGGHPTGGTAGRLIARDYVGRESHVLVAVDGLAEPLAVRCAPGDEPGDLVEVYVRGAVWWIQG